MSTRTKLPPGPAGLSCLTCKRRHKKCDRQRPVCDRCLKGGYECLGYEHNKSKGYSYDEPLPADHASLATLSSRPQRSSTPSLSPHGDDSPRKYGILAANVITIPGIYEDSEAGPLVRSGMAHVQQDLSDPFAFSNEDAVIYDTFPPTRSTTRVSANEILPPLHSASNQRLVFPTNPLLFKVASRMLKSVPIPLDVYGIVEYVISHFDRMLNITYFKPRGEQIEKFQRMSIWRLSTCDFSRQGMLIDAKIHESVLEGNHSMYTTDFTQWIEGFEQAVRTRLEEPLTGYEFQERLNDVLEMFLVKGRLLNTAATYDLFCRFVPNFFQMVYSDPTLWPTQDNPTLISMAHLLASPRYGPASYMIIDVMGSMVYGLPHLVDYNTDIELFHPEPHPVEWVDCFPGEFVVLLAKINTCRDQKSTEDWQSIEQRIVCWEPRPQFEIKGLESWKSVAWLALQESWKQTLLMYLYLAVCGVPTDDPRIQASLKQVFQLMGVIRRQDPPVSNVHFFAQCLIAGICSRTEKQRRLCLIIYG
ncbi:unnamed protein product [Rhizoctonia solani]|uniref:Zn(2)-C6 fungal-type domain-containing protein n=1 Tax=Rhizoctonia solani TaxID=456999 RepID=A0A8H3AIZ4_9AGAM|nr:unnamed protein product [Rhizoctonia solani]